VNAARIEERFITYVVLASAKVTLQNQPKQYQDARVLIEKIVQKSSKYDEITKERFSMVLAVFDVCGVLGANMKPAVEAYDKIIADLIAQQKKLEEPEG
jgi:hypothetical protein